MNDSNLHESKVITRYENNPQNPPRSGFEFSNLSLQKSNITNQMQPQPYLFYPPPQNNNMPQINLAPQFSSPQQGFYDPRFTGVNWETAQTQNTEVKISRSCWLGYHRNNYHPSMTQYRISYDEFNKMIDKVEELSSSFKLIQTLYILMVLLSMIAVLLFVIGLFIEPGESVTDLDVFNTLDDASTGLIIVGLLVFFIGIAVIAIVIMSTLKKYEFNIKKMLQEENQHAYYSRNIQWLITPHCQQIVIKCLPVTAQQYYIMLQQTNQLKMSKEYLEKLKKEQPKD